MMLALTRRYGLEPPVCRILKENGRLSNHSMYIVAVFSGTEKLGTGFGISIKMAESRASLQETTFALGSKFLHILINTA